MKSLIKETLRAAYTLSPIIILLVVSGMALMKKERKKINAPEEQKEIKADHLAKNKMYEVNCSVFNPVSSTGSLLSL